MPPADPHASAIASSRRGSCCKGRSWSARRWPLERFNSGEPIRLSAFPLAALISAVIFRIVQRIRTDSVEEMNLYLARNLAKSLMQVHGLAGWMFQFDHARRRFGTCSPSRKRITLSRPLTLLNNEAEV